MASRLIAFACGVALGMTSAVAPDSAAQSGFPADVAAAMRGIDAERIRAHVAFLADDLLEGRGTAMQAG